MVVNLALLVFVGSALLALVSLAGTWRRYRDVALANLAALRHVADDRAGGPQLADPSAALPPVEPARRWTGAWPVTPPRPAAAAGLHVAASPGRS